MNRATVNKIFQKHPVYVKAGMIAVISIIIFGCVYSKDNGKKLEKDEKGREILRRNESGKDELKNMKVKIDEKQEDISISVSGKKYDEEELKNAFSEAEKEVEQAVLGKNKSLDEVRSDLNLITSVPEKNMKVSWELDRYDVMDIQGHLQQDNLSTEGTLIKLTVILTYEDEEERYEFYAKVFPSELSADKEEMRQLQEKVEEADKKTKTKDYIILPEQVNGKKVIWAYGVQTRADGILVMGIEFAVFVIKSSSKKEKEEKKKEFREMKLDYPQIINKFNLYIKSGMTIRKAWFKIAGEYEKDQKEKEQISAKACGRKKAYEEMVNVMYKISGGASEGECYEEYGIRCNLSEYRKFGMMLSQNLRKGTRGLTELLEREAEDAFEQRKNLAKKAGEEAGTKLMIPLFLMLIIVFAIVIVPAFFSIRI